MIPGIMAAIKHGGGAADPYWDNVVSLLRFEGVDGSTTFSDEKGVIWTPTNAVISDAQSIDGGTSGYFNGSAEISSESLAGLALGTGDFTVECFLRRNAGTAYANFFDNRPSDAIGYGAYAAGAPADGAFPALADNADVIIFGTQQVPALTWTHVALARVSGVVTLYVAGVTAGSKTDTRNIAATRFRLGYSWLAGHPYAGYIDQFRVTKGVARYTADFTPPTEPFPTH